MAGTNIGASSGIGGSTALSGGFGDVSALINKPSGKPKVTKSASAGKVRPTTQAKTSSSSDAKPPADTQTSVVTLAGIGLKDFEIPPAVSAPNKQALTTHKFPGGARVIDAMGSDPGKITWSGMMIGPDSYDRARLFSRLCDAGARVPLFFGDFYLHVVIESFDPDYQFNQVNYRISCEVSPDPGKSATTNAVRAAQQAVAQSMTNVSNAIGNMSGQTQSTSSQNVGSAQGVTTNVDSQTAGDLPQLSAANDALSSTGNDISGLKVPGDPGYSGGAAAGLSVNGDAGYSASGGSGFSLPGDAGYSGSGGSGVSLPGDAGYSGGGSDPGIAVPGDGGYTPINPSDPGFTQTQSSAVLSMQGTAQTISDGNALNDQQLSEISDRSANGMTAADLNASVSASGQQAQLMPVQASTVVASNNLTSDIGPAPGQPGSITGTVKPLNLNGSGASLLQPAAPLFPASSTRSLFP